MRLYPVSRWVSPALLLLAALSGCRDNEPSELRFGEPRVVGLYYTFRDQPRAELPAELAFTVRKACPRVDRARYEPGEGEMGTLTVWGQGLDRVSRLAASRSGPLGEAPPHAELDGSLRFAVGCRECELVMGMKVAGVMVGCRGPGYSLRLMDGRLVSEWEEPLGR